MVAVQVVERAVDEVVDVVAMRDLRMAAAGVVLRGALDRGAGVRVAPIDLEHVLGDGRVSGRMKVPVVEIIGVIAMTNGPMTAARPVLVRVSRLLIHGASPSSSGRMVPAGVRGQGRSEAA